MPLFWGYFCLFSGNPYLFRAVPVISGVNFSPFWCIHPHFDSICCIPATLHHYPNPSGGSLQLGVPFHTFGILFMAPRSHFLHVFGSLLYTFGSLFHIFGSFFYILCPFSYIFGSFFPYFESIFLYFRVPFLYFHTPFYTSVPLF